MTVKADFEAGDSPNRSSSRRPLPMLPLADTTAAVGTIPADGKEITLNNRQRANDRMLSQL